MWPHRCTRWGSSFFLDTVVTLVRKLWRYEYIEIWCDELIFKYNVGGASGKDKGNTKASDQSFWLVLTRTSVGRLHFS
jgi:hypothetical protein